MAARARFELATLRLTAEGSKNLNAVSGVACTETDLILPRSAAPNPAPILNLTNPDFSEERGNLNSGSEN